MREATIHIQISGKNRKRQCEKILETMRQFHYDDGATWFEYEYEDVEKYLVLEIEIWSGNAFNAKQLKTILQDAKLWFFRRSCHIVTKIKYDVVVENNA